jgi:hypothetical protein
MKPELERITFFSIPCAIFMFDIDDHSPRLEAGPELTARIRKAVLDCTGTELSPTMRVWQCDVIPGDPIRMKCLLVDDDAYLTIRSRGIGAAILDDLLGLLLAIGFLQGRPVSLEDVLGTLTTAAEQHPSIHGRLRSLLGHGFGENHE